MRTSVKGFGVLILPILLIQSILIGFYANTYGQGVDTPQQQLRLKVLADKYLVQAEQLHEKKDFAGALKLIEKIIALEKAHNFNLPDGFHFKHALIAYSAGRIHSAIDALHEYLAPETEGEFYKDALALLIKAEEENEEVVIAPENTCTGKPPGSSCWLALANRPKCYVWNPNLQRRESATWTGKCFGGVARREGTLEWAVADNDSLGTLRTTGTSTGSLRRGKFHGYWVSQDSDGSRSEGSYVDGRKHGLWVWRNIHQGRMIQGSRGEYRLGKREGSWFYYDEAYREPDCESITFRQGVEIARRNVGLESCQW